MFNATKIVPHLIVNTTTNLVESKNYETLIKEKATRPNILHKALNRISRCLLLVLLIFYVLFFYV